MSGFKLEVLAHSKAPNGEEIFSVLATFPRIILSELNTHCALARNSASSRAIPAIKMQRLVEEHSFIPLAWQKEHPGMQGTEYFSEKDTVKNMDTQKVLDDVRGIYLAAKTNMLTYSKLLSSYRVTKQITNRLLEPFMYHTAIITATDLENFFELRCPKYRIKYGKVNKTFRSIRDAAVVLSNIANETQDISYDVEAENLKGLDLLGRLSIDESGAEIHIQRLAEMMWDAYNDSTPVHLQSGEWHMPFGDTLDVERLIQLEKTLNTKDRTRLALHICTARIARTSYLNFEGKDDYEADIKLHDTLLASGHMSPFEHCARVMTEDEYSNKYYTVFNGVKNSGRCGKYRGFISYRHMIPGETKQDNKRP